MVCIVVQGVGSNLSPCVAAQRLAGVGVGVEPGEVGAGHVQAYSVASGEEGGRLKCFSKWDSSILSNRVQAPALKSAAG